MSHKLIVAILPTDVDALRVLKRLKEEQGIVSANLNYARGMGHITRDRSLRTETTQREILSLVVPAERSDAIFAWLYEAADVNRLHGGIVYVQPLAEATEYRLPDVPEEAGEPET